MNFSKITIQNIIKFFLIVTATLHADILVTNQDVLTKNETLTRVLGDGYSIVETKPIEAGSAPGSYYVMAESSALTNEQKGQECSAILLINLTKREDGLYESRDQLLDSKCTDLAKEEASTEEIPEIPSTSQIADADVEIATETEEVQEVEEVEGPLVNEEVPEEAGAQEVDEENGDTEAELSEEDLDEEEVATEDEDGVDLKDKTVRVIRKDGKLIKKVIGIKGQGKTKVIEYNSKGKPRKITNYNEEGSIQSITKNQYKNGQIAKSVTKDASGAITRETFNKKGAVIKEVFDAEKNLVSLTKTTKSGEQRILEETTTARGKMITERTEDGQITRRKLVNPKNGKTIRVAKYDENGNAVAVKTYDKKGNLKSETSKKYTADGSLKKSKQVNSDGSKKIIRKSQAPREDGSVKFKTKVNKTSGDQKSSKSNGNPWPTAMSAAKTGAPTTQGPVAAPLKSESKKNKNGGKKNKEDKKGGKNKKKK